MTIWITTYLTTYTYSLYTWQHLSQSIELCQICYFCSKIKDFLHLDKYIPCLCRWNYLVKWVNAISLRLQPTNCAKQMKHKLPYICKKSNTKPRVNILSLYYYKSFKNLKRNKIKYNYIRENVWFKHNLFHGNLYLENNLFQNSDKK